MYYCRGGVEQNHDVEAAKWYRLSAEAGGGHRHSAISVACINTIKVEA